MQWERRKPAEGRCMPWKNGQGSTLELAIQPREATLATGFAWRLSSAELRESGPFSPFPGLERWLLLLEGDGFRLDLGARGTRSFEAPLVPERFAGDWPATAELVGGPCRDLNLMVDPQQCRAQVTVQTWSTAGVLPLRAATSLLFVARGSLSVPSLDLHLGCGHLLRLEAGQGQLPVAPGLAGASLVWLELDRA